LSNFTQFLENKLSNHPAAEIVSEEKVVEIVFVSFGKKVEKLFRFIHPF
jgi:hypothetical protein